MGSIEAGAVADCVLYDLDAFSLLPHADPIVSLVLSSARPTVGRQTVFVIVISSENDYQDHFNTTTAGKLIIYAGQVDRKSTQSSLEASEWCARPADPLHPSLQ